MAEVENAEFRAKVANTMGAVGLGATLVVPEVGEVSVCLGKGRSMGKPSAKRAARAS